MKVIISCLNSKYVHASLSPWCLFAGVREFSKRKYDISVMESTINSNIGLFAEDILNEKPDVVAFSCYIWNILSTIDICRAIKEKHECKIVLGGPEVAYRSRDILDQYSFIDYVVSGEGEWSFPLFLDNINDDLSVVHGLSYRKNNEIVVNQEIEYKDTPPSPFCDEFFDNLKGRISYIETSRGCPYRCAFCLSGRCSSLRFFDINRVKNDIIKLSQSGTQTVKFIDRTFNADAKRSDEFLLFIKDNYGKSIPENVCFHFEVAGDILKDSTLEILSSMPFGSVQLEIGVQSFNKETLNAINRKTNIDKLVKNIRKLIGFGNIHIHIDLIAGLTCEDLESFRNGFDIGYSLNAHMLQMGFLKLLYGADMRMNTEKYPCTFSSNPPYEVTSTPWLSADEISMLKNCEDALDRLYNSGRFLLSLQYLTEEVGIRPFDLFNDFGNYVSGNKMQLSEYAEKFYNYFADRCDKEILREKIVCDMLCCSSSVHIPDSLKIKDPLYKKVKKYLTDKDNINMRFAILYSVNKVFSVSDTEPKNLYGRYNGTYYDLDKISL